MRKQVQDINVHAQACDGIGAAVPDQSDVSDAGGTILEGVLKSYGVPWTHVTLLSGVVLSSFHWTSILDPAAWMVGSVLAFLTAYLFRRQWVGALGKTALTGLFAFLIALAVPSTWCALNDQDLLSFARANKYSATGYVAFFFVTPLALTILSYRGQEETETARYPKAIRQAMTQAMAQESLYRESQSYSISFVHVAGSDVTLETRLEYTLVNRTSATQSTRIAFFSPSTHAEYLEARLGNQEFDVEDRDFLSARGFGIDQKLRPRQKLRVVFRVREKFPKDYSELYTAYVPTTSLKLLVTNPWQHEMQTYIESLLPEKAAVKHTGDEMSCQSTAGVLPYQGFRLYWHPK